MPDLEESNIGSSQNLVSVHHYLCICIVFSQIYIMYSYIATYLGSLHFTATIQPDVIITSEGGLDSPYVHILATTCCSLAVRFNLIIMHAVFKFSA